jgi:Exocyst complex component Sec10-like, alpha-helical bundle
VGYATRPRHYPAERGTRPDGSLSRNSAYCWTGIRDYPSGLSKPTFCHAGFSPTCFCSIGGSQFYTGTDDQYDVGYLQIQQYLELLLAKAQSLSTLAYLRILQLAHVQVSKLVEDLKAYDISSALSPRSPNTAEQQALGSGVANPAAPGAGAGLVVAIGTMLENAMEELFVPYNEGTKYLDKETKSLSEIYSTYLNRFTKYHVCCSWVPHTFLLLTINE